MDGPYGDLLKTTRHGAGGEAVELTGQVMTFVMIMVTGMVLGVLFDFYRVLRGTFNPQALMTWFTDLLYWLIATAIVFFSLVLSNWGELRFYVFIGILGGLGLYYKWLSLWAIRLFSSGIGFIIAGLRFMKRIFIHIILRPGIYCIRMVSWPLVFLWHKIMAWCHTRWIKSPDDEKK